MYFEVQLAVPANDVSKGVPAAGRTLYQFGNVLPALVCVSMSSKNSPTVWPMVTTGRSRELFDAARMRRS